MVVERYDHHSDDDLVEILSLTPFADEKAIVSSTVKRMESQLANSKGSTEVRCNLIEVINNLYNYHVVGEAFVIFLL